MKNEIFQKVFDVLQPVLPTEWRKMILYAAYTEGSYSMKFYTSDNNGRYTDCFSQPGVNDDDVVSAFIDINEILAPERKMLDDINRWSVMTMIVEADGTMKTEFAYDDISENTIAYERKWKETHLK